MLRKRVGSRAARNIKRFLLFVLSLRNEIERNFTHNIEIKRRIVVSLSIILDKIVIQKFNRRKPVKRTHGTVKSAQE